MTTLRRLSLGLAILTTGLIAGFFYAYACSVTLGLARLDDGGYIAAMQAINATVRNPVFAFSFFGALLSIGVAVALHVREGWTPRTGLVLLAFITYALGGLGLTLGANVPLNEDLARVSLDATPEALAQVREDYEGTWNAWNVARTVFTTAAFLLLIAAPFVRSAPAVATTASRERDATALSANLR